MVAVSRYLPNYLLRPVDLVTSYDREKIQPDIVAGITVAVIGLPQAIAFAIIADLPPQMGLFAIIVGAVAGALWGSSDQVHTGPANAISLLVGSTLAAVAAPDTAQYILAAGLLAFMAGIFQVTLGLARLGMLVNFVSHSVIVGFATGAGILIGIKQIQPLFGISFESGNIVETLYQAVLHLPESHLPTAVIGIGTIVLIVVLAKINPKLPGPLISMVIGTAAVFALGLDAAGVDVIGSLPSSLPPLAELPLLNLGLISELSTGALAVGAIGLVQSAAIGRSMATKTGQRLDSNQEFVGQGLANIGAGLFSGYPVTASFSRSAVNIEAGARSPVAAIFSSLFILLALFVLAPAAAYLPMSALAGVLMVTAYRLVDVEEIRRIWSGAREDAVIMLVTLLGTLFLRLDFAVLAGILMSFAIYIMNTSAPRVRPVVPDDNFRHFVHQPDTPECPQLGIIEIQGDLYFGAANHVEQAIFGHMDASPTQRFLLIRMQNVNHCDFSGIHMLESIVTAYRGRNGDVFMVRVPDKVYDFMHKTNFCSFLGTENFLDEDTAIEYLFRHVLDPAICIYESNVRVFRECQTLTRPDYVVEISTDDIPITDIETIAPRRLWEQLRKENPPLVIDVREPREYRRGHIPDATLTPLPNILHNPDTIPQDREVVFVCRGGRRSRRAAQFAKGCGCTKARVLEGGMVAWESEELLKAVETEWE